MNGIRGEWMLSKEKRKNEKSILKLTEVPEIFKGRCGRGYRISQRKRSNPVLIQSPSTYTLIHITHTHTHTCTYPSPLFHTPSPWSPQPLCWFLLCFCLALCLSLFDFHAPPSVSFTLCLAPLSCPSLSLSLPLLLAGWFSFSLGLPLPASLNFSTVPSLYPGCGKYLKLNQKAKPGMGQPLPLQSLTIWPQALELARH